MNAPAHSLDIRHVLNEHVAEVFKTMLSVHAAPAAGDAIPSFGDHVTGSVGFGGDQVTGAVYLHLSADLAARLAGSMLGLSAEELGEAEVNDVVGEITNMLTGQLKSCLCDAGAPCAVSTPSLIRGTMYEIENLQGVRKELLLFDCEGSAFAVEVHIKFN
jgi:CheY-specific phosphatase CheX